jgi:hypothetical protein
MKLSISGTPEEITEFLFNFISSSTDCESTKEIPISDEDDMVGFK